MKESPELRSRIMRAVKSSNTTPELLVRRLVHGLGYRFRLYRKDLPGRPDLILSRLRKTIFVNGCFWHGHDCARGARVPKRNRAYWQQKVASNRARDQKNLEKLAKAGWKSLVVWECATRDENDLKRRLSSFLKK